MNKQFSKTSLRLTAIAIGLVLFLCSWGINCLALALGGLGLFLLVPGVIIGAVCGWWFAYVVWEWRHGELR